MQSSPSIFKDVSEPTLGLRIYRATQTLPLKSQWRFLTALLLVSDTAMLFAGFYLAYLFRFQLALPFFQSEFLPQAGFYRVLILGLTLLWLLFIAFNGLYQQRNLLGGIREYSLIFGASTLSTVSVIILSFLLPDFRLARGWLIVAWLSTSFLLISMRLLLRRFVYQLRRQGYFLSPAIIVGNNSEGQSLAQQLTTWQTSGYHVLGFVADGAPLANGRLPVLGSLQQLEDIINKFGITEVIIATSALSRNEIVDIFTRYGLSAHVNISLSSGLFEIITTGLELKETHSVPLVGINKVRLTNVERLLKLILDYAIVLPSLIVVVPLMAIVALLVKLDSPGPVIYRRRVMGLNGRQFNAYKFRTMHINGDDLLATYPKLQEELAVEHKLKDDPRVTKLGHVLRRLSLDELPQLFNVLKREMSLVGPRMISPPEMAMYRQWQTNLLTVHPGITGSWQVSGRSDISYEERVNIDMRYIRNWTLWLDLQILFQTIPAVLKARGAY